MTVAPGSTCGGTGAEVSFEFVCPLIVIAVTHAAFSSVADRRAAWRR